VSATGSGDSVANLAGTRRLLWVALVLDGVGLAWTVLLRVFLGCDPLRALTPMLVVPLILGAVLGISSAARAPLRALGSVAFVGGLVAIGVTIVGTAGLRSC
jgi:hypothetical protein